MSVGSRDLVALARRAMKAKQRQTGSSSGRDRGLESERRERQPDVREAAGNLRRTGGEFEDMVFVEGAKQDAQVAPGRARQMDAVETARRDLARVPGPIDQDHGSSSGTEASHARDAAGTAAGETSGARRTAPRQLRQAYLYSLLLDKPLARKPAFFRPDWQGPWDPQD